MIRDFSKRWLQFAPATAAALALWALAAARGYAWQMIWLPLRPRVPRGHHTAAVGSTTACAGCGAIATDGYDRPAGRYSRRRARARLRVLGRRQPPRACSDPTCSTSNPARQDRLQHARRRHLGDERQRRRPAPHHPLGRGIEFDADFSPDGRRIFFRTSRGRYAQTRTGSASSSPPGHQTARRSPLAASPTAAARSTRSTS